MRRGGIKVSRFSPILCCEKESVVNRQFSSTVPKSSCCPLCSSRLRVLAFVCLCVKRENYSDWFVCPSVCLLAIVAEWCGALGRCCERVQWGPKRGDGGACKRWLRREYTTANWVDRMGRYLCWKCVKANQKHAASIPPLQAIAEAAAGNCFCRRCLCRCCNSSCRRRMLLITSSERINERTMERTNVNCSLRSQPLCKQYTLSTNAAANLVANELISSVFLPYRYFVHSL